MNKESKPILLRYAASPLVENGIESIDYHELYHRWEKSKDSRIKKILNDKFGLNWHPKKEIFNSGDTWCKDKTCFYNNKKI